MNATTHRLLNGTSHFWREAGWRDETCCYRPGALDTANARLILFQGTVLFDFFKGDVKEVPCPFQVQLTEMHRGQQREAPFLSFTTSGHLIAQPLPSNPNRTEIQINWTEG